MHLQYIIVCRDYFLYIASDSGGFVILGVVGINAYTGENYSCCLIYFLFKPTSKVINFFHSHCIGQFNMNRGYVFIRSVIVDYQVVSTADFFFFIYDK